MRHLAASVQGNFRNRSGVKVEKIVEQLKGIGGEYPVFQKDGLVLSIPDAISRVLEKRYLKTGSYKRRHKYENSLMGEICPECGQRIRMLRAPRKR